jgi:hypothetical protein
VRQSRHKGAADGTFTFAARIPDVHGWLGLMILFSLGQFGGFLHARHAARSDPALADLARAMRDHKTRQLGLSPLDPGLQ